MEKYIYDSIIIGSGPAGLTAAIYNVRADLKTLVIAGSQPGGQLTVTTTVDNFPGFPDGTGGVKLMMDMMEQAKKLGAEIKVELVNKIIKEENIFKIILSNNEELFSKSVIICFTMTLRINLFLKWRRDTLHWCLRKIIGILTNYI